MAYIWLYTPLPDSHTISPTRGEAGDMNDIYDLELTIRSRIPIIVIETHEENRVVEMFKRIAIRFATPLFRWTVTQGLQRLDLDYPPQRHNIEPAAVIGQIRSTTKKGMYLLLDFHPYFTDPLIVRALREVAQAYDELGHTVVLISHGLEIPPELRKQCAHFELSLPDTAKLKEIVMDEARLWSSRNQGARVKTDSKTLDLLIRNLSGLTMSDAKRLARNAIYDDGAITQEDLPEVMAAKYKLFNKEGLLTFEYETARFTEVGGLKNLKRWLEQRRSVFQDDAPPGNLDKPKGIMLLGVQGCGKSLAARAVAGMWNIPLLRLDFAVLYNKYIGETEKNLRASLKTAAVMAPCVLWIDEIEKGLAADESDSGTSRRILGTLLTWMSENKSGVFVVATANDITSLPPELVRKGRMDEIFFVDLPDMATRLTIFGVHLNKRGLTPTEFDLTALANAAEGFSGSEIEQAVVSALYSSHASKAKLETAHILEEVRRTRPLSVVMAEKIAALRQWAKSRTVPAG